MPRPERPLDPTAGPVQAFAAELRDLRRAAGDPKYLQMARRTGKSRTALAEAAGGDHLPTWETVEAFVQACGGEPARWRVRWEGVRDELQARRRAATQPVVLGAEPVAAPRNEPARDETVHDVPVHKGPVHDGTVGQETVRHETGRGERPGYGRGSRAALLAGVLSALTIVSASTVAVAVMVSLELRAPSDALREHSVRIANTDAVPVTLSARPIARCGELGCGVAGIELWPGDSLTVFCYTSGELVSESVLDPVVPGGDDRRGRQSNGWYGSRLGDRVVYLPEVYVTPETQRGLGLGACQPGPSLEPR